MAQYPISSSEHLNYLPPADYGVAEAFIELNKVVKTYKNAAGEFTALKGITTCFYPGEFVSIVGKSGSGKSTLANMLTGIDHPTSGTVRIGDIYVHTLNENDRSLWRGRNLGIVFQFFQLMPTLTLLENVMLPMVLVNRYSPVQREKQAMELLNLVGLGAFAETLPAAVAGGQQQAAAIARALANDPPILIADEPTGNLDSQTASEIFGLFCELIERGKTVLMVTHDSALAQQTTRTLLLSDGELIDPWVVTAFPDLLHPHLLWINQHVTHRELPPGTPLSMATDSKFGLWIVTKGSLELRHPGCQQPTLLETGHGLCKLPGSVIDWQNITLQAGVEESVEFWEIDSTTLEGWLRETPGAGADLDKANPACWIVEWLTGIKN